MKKRIILVTVLVCVAVLMGTGYAQQPAEQPPNPNLKQATAGSPLVWDVDLILRPYVKALTRYYNLNEDQEKYTQLLLTQRVKRFLSDHERDTRSLFGEYWDYQKNGQLPPPEAAKEFAQRAQPLMAAMYKEIVDGNMKWREILNDEQKKQHDKDLGGIDKTFKELDEKLTRWSKGDVQPTDMPSTVGEQPRAIMKPEDAWQYYVRMFIVDYRLDEAQQAASWSVLEDLRKEASAYRLAHKDAFTELEAKYLELAQADPKTDPKELEKVRSKREALDKKREQLEGSISVGMFNRLKQKLSVIPRSDQREAYEKQKVQLDKVAKQARAELEARIASQPASQPAASQPTTHASRSASEKNTRPRKVHTTPRSNSNG